MKTRIGWSPAIALALAFCTCTSIPAEDAVPAEAAWSSIQDVVKADGLKLRVQGWAEGKPQPLEDENGEAKKWPWYRLTFEGGPKTFVFYSFQAPFVSSCEKVSLVEWAGEGWLLARMDLEDDSDKPHVYFPLELDGKAGSFLYADAEAKTWKFVSEQRLFDWETSPEAKDEAQMTLDRMVRGQPQPIQSGEILEEPALLYRVVIQHHGQTHTFLICETQPLHSRWIKVTREKFDGQDCFKLANLMERLAIEIYLPIAMAGRYGSFMPFKDGEEHAYILKSLDDIMMECFASADGWVDEEDDEEGAASVEKDAQSQALGYASVKSRTGNSACIRSGCRAAMCGETVAEPGPSPCRSHDGGVALIPRSTFVAI